MHAKLAATFIVLVKTVNGLLGGYIAMACYTAIAYKTEEEMVGPSQGPVTTDH